METTSVISAEVIRQALEKLLPDLLPEEYEEITKRLIMHLFVYAEKMLFNTPQEYQLVEKILEQTKDTDKQTSLVAEVFAQKFKTLTAEEQISYAQALEEELVKKGHEIYLALKEE